MENRADENVIYCKGCNKPFQRIRGHLTKTRKTIRCEDAYLPEELQAFENEYIRNNNKAKKRYQQENPEKNCRANKNLQSSKFLKNSSIQKGMVQKKERRFRKSILKIYKRMFWPNIYMYLLLQGSFQKECRKTQR